VQKYIRAALATDDNMAHAHCTLDTKGYEHSLSEYVILVAFPLQHSLHEPFHCRTIRTLPVLLRNSQTVPYLCLQEHLTAFRHTVTTLRAAYSVQYSLA